MRLIKLHPGINSRVAKEMTGRDRVGAREKRQKARKVERSMTTRATAAAAALIKERTVAID